MQTINIILIEDQREVLQAVSRDLIVLEGVFAVEECESAAEAHEVLEEIERRGDYAALIISDQVMPKKTGVEFLIDVHRDWRFTGTRKMLLTGLATHRDTIEAINRAHVDRYIGKPWNRQELLDAVKSLVTEFILEKEIPYEKYLGFLDEEIIGKQLALKR